MNVIQEKQQMSPIKHPPYSIQIMWGCGWGKDDINYKDKHGKPRKM
jgi:hypothetical protein